MYSIEKKFKFEASHRLNCLDYDSPCKNIHGHSYKVFLKIKASSLNEQHMIIDFTHLKEFQDFFDSKYDHACIIEKSDIKFIEFVKKNGFKYLVWPHPTTAERMAIIFCAVAKAMFKNKIKDLKEITIQIYETENNCASYTHIFE